MMAAALVWAQTEDPSRGVRVQGEISSSRMLPGLLTVELSSSGGGVGESTTVNPDGTFEFRSATPGMRQLRLSAAGGAVIYQEFVNIIGPAQRLSIRLPDAPNASRAAGDTVSLQQLQHKVPSAARKAFDKGVLAAHKGKEAEAEAFFRKAVEVDPEFADAYNELGAAEVSLGKLPEAAGNFQKAIDLAPEHRLALPNLSIVLAKMKRYREAGQVARRALRVMPASPTLRFILAASLIAGHGDTEEAMANLRQAETAIPKAHLLEAQLLEEEGHRADAVTEVEEYLRVAAPNDPDRGKIEAYLAELQHKTGAKD
jgi:tetratricopeptide (TPR) repeat protein